MSHLCHSLLRSAAAMLPDDSTLRSNARRLLLGQYDPDAAAAVVVAVCGAAQAVMAKYILPRFRASRLYQHLTQVLVRRLLWL